MTGLKEKVAKGAIWVLAERLSGQVVQFIVGMILARLLTPTEFGTVGLTGLFFVIAEAFIYCGFSGALVRKKDADDLDYNTVFYLLLTTSTVMYWIIFFSAPWIADFYHVPELKSIVRVSAILFITNAINSMQSVELQRKMLFHLSFRISMISVFTSAICGVTLAYLGYGVWALVWTSIITGVVGVISRWFIIAWRPKLMFSFARLKPLFAYGWKMALSGLIDRFFGQLKTLLIGKFYTRADIAFVAKGYSLPQLVMGEVNSTVGRVSFPALVQMQDDRIRLRDAMRRMMTCSSFLVMPAMVGVAACAKSELRLLYGEQWTPAAPYMMLACFAYALFPFHTINLRGILALGRSDVYLKLEILKKILAVLAIVGFFRYGVLVYMAASTFVLGPLSVLINSWPNRKLLNYPLGMQIRDILPTVLLCVVEAVVVFGIDLLWNVVGLGFARTGSIWSLVGVLILQILCGATTFFSLAYAFRLAPMKEYVRMLSVALKGRFPSIISCLERRFM